MKQPSKTITVSEVVSVAVERYRSWPFTPLDEIANRRKRNPAVISRMIARAFREGLVEVRPCRSRLSGRRLSSVEDQLLRKYPGLQSAIVLDLRQNESESFPENQDDSSDAVHQGLGLAMANFIVQGSVLRDGDVIGLGDGRAVYHTVTTLPGPGCLKQLNASVVSLSGFTPSGGAFRTKNTAMDADINVALLGPAFANPVRLELMTHPLVYPDSEVSMRVRNNTWLWDASRPGLHPTVALVGIGTFGKGHRLYEFARHAAASLSMVPAGSALEELADLCEPFQASPYSPVADIANCLFFVKPPKSIVVPAVRVERIRHLIDQVNDTLHTISWSAIKKIPLVLLIAGTLKKAYAIRAILQLMPTNIRAICTNHQTAGLLLSER